MYHCDAKCLKEKLLLLLRISFSTSLHKNKNTPKAMLAHFLEMPISVCWQRQARELLTNIYVHVQQRLSPASDLQAEKCKSCVTCVGRRKSTISCRLIKPQNKMFTPILVSLVTGLFFFLSMRVTTFVTTFAQ